MIPSDPDGRALFSGIPDDCSRAGTAGSFWLRPFGIQPEDMDVDFHLQRPFLVTSIITRCISTTGDSPKGSFVRNLPVGTRIAGLLILASIAGRDELEVTFRCRTCEELLEAEIPFELLRPKEPMVTRFPVRLGENVVTVRAPTGYDQEQWLSREFTDEEEAISIMAHSLIVQNGNAHVPVSLIPGWAGILNRALQEHDPLVGFALRTTCPNCKREDTYSIDLEAIILKQLQTIQQQIIRDIHRIACHYHWSEREILAISPARRVRYLDMILSEES